MALPSTDQKTEPTQVDITAGPGKWDLMLSLLEGDSNHRHLVWFTVGKQGTGEGKLSQYMEIDSISREDGSGECWNFEGRWCVDPNHVVKGFYSTKTRTGWTQLY